MSHVACRTSHVARRTPHVARRTSHGAVHVMLNVARLHLALGLIVDKVLLAELRRHWRKHVTHTKPECASVAHLKCDHLLRVPLACASIELVGRASSAYVERESGCA